MFINNFLEFGHHTPQFLFLFLVISAYYHENKMYIFLILFGIIDYAFIGPYMKHIFYENNMGSARPILYPYIHSDSIPKHFNGMPSGHSELVWFICTVLYFTMGTSDFDTFFCFILAIFTSLQRILTKMHTPLHVITGSFIGITFGIVWSFFYNVLSIQF